MEDGQISLCDLREDYTDEERSVWEGYLVESMERLSEAIGALPHPIPQNTSGDVVCPNCQGILEYARWRGGAALGCATTEHCVPITRFNIDADADWPMTEDGSK